MNRILAAFLTAALIAPSLPAVSAENDTETITYNYSYDQTNGYEALRAHTRQMEKLDRGLVAIKSGNGVYLSWRLFDSEDAIYGSAKSNVEFVVYRDGKEIAVVKGKTNYTDKTAGTRYTVAPIIDGVEWPQCEPVTVMDNNYFDILLDKPEDAILPRISSLKAYDGKNYNYFVTDAAPDVTANDYAANVDYVVSGWRDPNVGHKPYPYTAGDCSTGDVDGDGEYEIIVKWDCNAQDNSLSGVTGNVYLDAYKQDRTKLWRIDLGKNIRGGAHYTQFLVYDFDGDGKAEMMCKTAPNSKGANGEYITKASHVDTIKSVSDEKNEMDYRNNDGYVLDGDEYLTVFDGKTGNAVDTIYYPNQRVDVSVWGDTNGNRVDRFTGAVAYLDGQKPYAVYMRGYYFGRNGQQRQAACGVSFDGSELECKYSFDTYDVNQYKNKLSSSSYDEDGNYKGVDGYREGNGQYVGQGNHNCTVADVDNDGKDEVITGALCYELENEVLGVKWCTYLQHGDALHIGDYDPTHKGFEFFTVHEDSGTNTMSGEAITMDYGMSVIDADTGEIMFHVPNSKDTGRGVMANTGSGGYYQITGVGSYQCNGGKNFTTTANGAGSNFRIFWDGDVYDELLDGTTVTNYNGTGFNASQYGCIQINGTKANPALQADLFGDWREELVYPTSDNTKLRVFTTTTPTDYKIKTLMHDPVYRSGVAAEQTAYNQPPHVGFYMGKEDFLDKKLIEEDKSQPGGTQEITASKVRNEIGNQTKLSDTTKVFLNYYQYQWGLAYFGFENISDFDPDDILKAEIVIMPTDCATQNRTFNFKLLPADNTWETGIVTKNDRYPTIGNNAIISQSLRTTSIKKNEELAFDVTGYIKGFQKGTKEISVIAAVDGAAVMNVTNNPKLVLTLEATAVTPDPNKTPRPTYHPDTTDKPTETPTPTPSPSPSPTAAPTISPTASPTATPTVTPTPTNNDEAGYIEDYNFENKYATIHCGIDRENSLVLFASYENGKLVSIQAVNMPMQKDEIRKPQAKNLNDGDTVKVFVWDSIKNPKPLMKSKEFQR